MLEQITDKPTAPVVPCAVCRQPSAGEAWEVPLCAGHYGELMAGDLLTAGAIEANVASRPWSAEGLAIADREPLLERYRREFDAEAERRVAKWVSEQRKAAA